MEDFSYPVGTNNPQTEGPIKLSPLNYAGERVVKNQDRAQQEWLVSVP